MQKSSKKILPASYYDTVSDATLKNGAYVWGYSVNDGHGTFGPLYPSFTIEARRNVPVRVCYANTLNNTVLQTIPQRGSKQSIGLTLTM